jgi:hypothetical protein
MVTEQEADSQKADMLGPPLFPFTPAQISTRKIIRDAFLHHFFPLKPQKFPTSYHTYTPSPPLQKEEEHLVEVEGLSGLLPA